MIEREERRGLRDVLARRDVALQPVARDVAEGVARQAGIVHVRHDHRVGEARRQRPAVRGEAAQLQLDVVRDEEAIGSQQRPAARRDSSCVPPSDSRDRHDERLGLLHRQRRREQLVVAFRRRRLEPDRDLGRVADELADVVARSPQSGSRFDRRRLGQKLLHQRRELEPREDVVQLRAIGLLPLQRFEVDVVDVEVALDAAPARAT